MLLQTVCEFNHFWRNVAILALGGTHDGTHHCAPSSWNILQHEILIKKKQVLDQRDKNIRPYVVGDAIYHFLINIPKLYILNIF